MTPTTADRGHRTNPPATAAPRGAMVLALVVTTVASVTVISHHHRRPHAVALALVPPLPLTVRASRGEPRLPLLPVNTPHAGEGTPRPHLAGVARPAGSSSGTILNWPALALCESSDNPRAVDPTGTYSGLYQFDASTWRSVGGTGNPADASRAEQTFRARILYGQRGRAPWPVCGVDL